MGAELRKVASGETFVFPAARHNALVDAADWVMGQQNRTGGAARTQRRPNTIILVRNDTEEDRARFDILGLDEPLIGPDDNEAEFQSAPAFSGVVPDAGLHAYRWAVLQEPLRAGQIGRAVLAGLTPARITRTAEEPTPQFVGLTPGECDTLRPVSAADAIGVQPAAVLWVAEGTGTQWALIDLAIHPPELYLAELAYDYWPGEQDSVAVTLTGYSEEQVTAYIPLTNRQGIGRAPGGTAPNNYAGTHCWVLWSRLRHRWEIVTGQFRLITEAKADDTIAPGATGPVFPWWLDYDTGVLVSSGHELMAVNWTGTTLHDGDRCVVSYDRHTDIYTIISAS